MRRCKIGNPVRGLISFNPYEYQIELVLDLSPSRLILKSRQTGVSQTVALEALHDALYKPFYTVLFVSKDKEAAVNLLNYAKTALEEGCPRPNGLKIVKKNSSEIIFSNGSKIKSIAATKNAGRSFAASAVYMDEAAFPIWAERIYQGVKPTVSTGGRITILSTPDGRANLFFLLWNGDIGSNFSKHRIHWTSCPAYYTADELAAGIPPEESKWYRANRPDYTEQVWASEYDCDFVQSGLACFKETDVEAVFDKELGFEEPVPGAEYVTFSDIGRRRDATVITTYKVIREGYKIIGKQIVAWERHEGLPYHEIAAKIDARGRQYPGLNLVESNNQGDPILEMCETDVEGRWTSNKSKVNMITALVFDVEKGLLKAPLIPQLRAEMLMYQWDDKRLIQDCVMSAAGASLDSKEQVATISVSESNTLGSPPPPTPQNRANALLEMMKQNRAGN